MTRCVAAGQTVPAPGDVDRNIARHLAVAEGAARAGARIVVFPEMSLTGYDPGRAPALAFTPDDVRLSPLRGAAAALGVTLVVGAPVRLGDRLHIGALLVAPDGEVDLYTKRYLGEGEDRVFAPGALDPLLSLGGRPAAVAVCADANHAAHPAAAATRGAATYLVSTFITPEELAPKTEALRAYAQRHRMAVVFANAGGPSGGLESGGRSAVWSEAGRVVAQLDGVGPGLVVATEGTDGWRGAAHPIDGG
ncbi:MAG: carbon-nitrogen hydrolase family protein [Sandaracinaceae bacterium]